MSESEDDILDAALFRYWIKLASITPSRVAVAIASCTSPSAYRSALIKLAKQDRLNLPYPDGEVA